MKKAELKKIIEEVIQETITEELENSVTFTIDDDDGQLDAAFMNSFSDNLEYVTDDIGDTYYKLPKRDFDRFVDFTDSNEEYNVEDIQEMGSEDPLTESSPKSLNDIYPTGEVDVWSRPIYKDDEGNIYVDIDLGNSEKLNLYTTTPEGEPLSPVRLEDDEYSVIGDFDEEGNLAENVGTPKTGRKIPKVPKKDSGKPHFLAEQYSRLFGTTLLEYGETDSGVEYHIDPKHPIMSAAGIPEDVAAEQIASELDLKSGMIDYNTNSIEISGITKNGNKLYVSQDGDFIYDQNFSRPEMTLDGQDIYDAARIEVDGWGGLGGDEEIDASRVDLWGHILKEQ